VKAEIEAAMLEACGERGYRNVSVQHVIESYGGNRVQFYRHFASKADCYASAYESGIELLCRRLLAAAEGEPSWRLGLRCVLAELARFVGEEPNRARGLLVEVHVAGGRAHDKRAEVCERLTQAMDGAREESDADRSAPRLTAPFMMGAIESSVARSLATEPAAFAEDVPELARMIVATYIGEAAADEELAALSAA
jgi:AcrR family transcriptional regulator